MSSAAVEAEAGDAAQLGSGEAWAEAGPPGEDEVIHLPYKQKNVLIALRTFFGVVGLGQFLLRLKTSLTFPQRKGKFCLLKV